MRFGMDKIAKINGSVMFDRLVEFDISIKKMRIYNLKSQLFRILCIFDLRYNTIEEWLLISVELKYLFENSM